jgi:hypothetical protein
MPWVNLSSIIWWGHAYQSQSRSRGTWLARWFNLQQNVCCLLYPTIRLVSKLLCNFCDWCPAIFFGSTRSQNVTSTIADPVEPKKYCKHYWRVDRVSITEGTWCSAFKCHATIRRCALHHAGIRSRPADQNTSVNGRILRWWSWRGRSYWGPVLDKHPYDEQPGWKDSFGSII